ncbi:DUF4041 domain-containing protein [Shewanella sp. S1-49-MNA-CIBAN-0167]|uniref:DUF4041 domain-containing protein n=1 Tax=Shewanella sp. S1-49-MNA-CIBAN-0167 TaxID=3140468 RepID=UPI00331D0215
MQQSFNYFSKVIIIMTMEGAIDMLNEPTTYQIISILFTIFTILNLFIIYSNYLNHGLIANEIVRKENLLENKSVEEIVSELKLSSQDLLQKKSAGQSVFQQLTETLKHNEERLAYINAGLLPPIFKFDDSELLKEQINQCREQQLIVILKRNATTAYSNWVWDGSKSKGTEMVVAYQDLLLKAFNAEFDVIRKQMRHSSYETARKKLIQLEDQLEKLGETTNVCISYEYVTLKSQELLTWHKELDHKEQLNNNKKAQQALLREQAKQAGQDTEDLEDDIYYRKSDLKKAQMLAQKMYGATAIDMKLKISKMQKEIERIEAKFERAISQAQITRAGYIYVISNIGSFGEGVVKIGMTRRLEPMDRVNELGDASVPFRFDVHSLTFVDDAPRIERTLHQKFNGKRVNVENHRKEFFKVTPLEVSNAMKELGIDSDWYFEVEAKEYRESLLIREALKQEHSTVKPMSSKLPEFI